MQEYLLLTLPLDSVHTEQIMLMQLQDEREFHFFQMTSATVAHFQALQKGLEIEIANKTMQVEMLKNGRVFSTYLLSRIEKLGIINTKKLHKFLFTAASWSEELDAIKLQLLKSLWTFKRNMQNLLHIRLEKDTAAFNPQLNTVIQIHAPRIKEVPAEAGNVYCQCFISVEKCTATDNKKFAKFIDSLSRTAYFCQATGTLFHHPVFNTYESRYNLLHCKDTEDQEILEYKKLEKNIRIAERRNRRCTPYGKRQQKNFSDAQTTAIQALNVLLRNQEENLSWHVQVDRFLTKKQASLHVGKDFFKTQKEFWHKDFGHTLILTHSQSVSASSSIYFTAELNSFRVYEQRLELENDEMLYFGQPAVDRPEQWWQVRLCTPRY